MNLYTAAILRDGARFLCLYHKGIARWVFPGGKPHPDETSVQCVGREVEEELGIALRGVRFRRAVIHQVNGREWVGLFFDVDAFLGEPRIQEPLKHDGMRWMTLDEMRQCPTSAPEMAIAEEIENL